MTASRITQRLLYLLSLTAAVVGLPGCVVHPQSGQLPAAVADLPLVQIPAAAAADAQGRDNDTLAIMLSGDGGWAGLDKAVGAALAAQGIPVVGWDSLRYYWKKRTPESASKDLARVIQTYTAAWHKPRVLLIGYSRGADVLPFLYNRLPDPSQAAVRHIVLLGLASDITFEYHLLAWVGLGPEGQAVMPEARKLPPDRTTCMYGVDDPDAVCDALNGTGFNVLALPGGHHFGHNYDKLARLIRATLDRRPGSPGAPAA